MATYNAYDSVMFPTIVLPIDNVKEWVYVAHNNHTVTVMIQCLSAMCSVSQLIININVCVFLHWQTVLLNVAPLYAVVDFSSYHQLQSNNVNTILILIDRWC